MVTPNVRSRNSKLSEHRSTLLQLATLGIPENLRSKSDIHLMLSPPCKNFNQDTDVGSYVIVRELGRRGQNKPQESVIQKVTKGQGRNFQF